jgi:hypothetical protein
MAGLYPAVPAWASAAVLGLLFIVGGAMLLRSGLSTLNGISTETSDTVKTLRDDATWVKEQLR